MPELPYELLLWLQCDEYGKLLVEGGVMDQPYLLWTQVRAAGTAYQEWQRMKPPKPPPGGAHGPSNQDI